MAKFNLSKQKHDAIGRSRPANNPKSRFRPRWYDWRLRGGSPDNDRNAVKLNRIYTSAHSGRKYMASVLGMANEADVYGPTAKARLPPFLAAWSHAWPGLYMEPQFSFANHPDLRGYGCLVGHYLTLANSLRFLEAHNETCDFHLVFEDDATPFREATWPATSNDNHLDARLDALVAAGGNFMILGGNVNNYNITDAASAATQPQGGILHAGHADGSYAYVFQCSALESAARFLHKQLRKVKTSLHVEKMIWDAFRAAAASQGGSASTGVYVSVPLMVDHRPGMSMTWNKMVDYPFEGNPNFWANEKVMDLSHKKDYP